jgi:hypothetical protein
LAINRLASYQAPPGKGVGITQSTLLFGAEWGGIPDSGNEPFCAESLGASLLGEHVHLVLRGRKLDESLDLLRLSVLEKRVSSLEKCCDRFEELHRNGPCSAIIPIDSLLPAPLVVVKTIHAFVHAEDDSFVSSFVDANINASGDSFLEAAENLKESIASAFEFFESKQGQLGEELQRQFSVLREFIVRR